MSCGCNKGYGASEVSMPDEYIHPYLSKGLVHPQVADFRRRLAAAYPAGKLQNLTSPEFDWDLEFTLNAYQFENGLPQTGVTDVATWARLTGEPAGQITLFTPEPVKQAPSSGGGGLWLVAAAAAAWWALS